MGVPITSRRGWFAPALALLLFAPAFASAVDEVPEATAPLDWNAVADEGTPVIVTTDVDGEPRETKLWVVVLDAQGYIRTGGTRWYHNIERDPEVVLRIGGAAHRLRAEPVEDEALRERVNQAFRSKYGVWDFVIHPFGAPDANIMRLVRR